MIQVNEGRIYNLYILVLYLVFRRDMQPLMVPRTIDIGDDWL